MKKISQIVIIFMLLIPIFSQVNAISPIALPQTYETEEDEIDPSYKKVDFDIKEVVIYPHGIVLIRKEATVNSGNKFYTEFEGNSFPGCVRIIEDDAFVKDITIKNNFNYRVYTPSTTDVFSINKLLNDNTGKTVELITSDAFYEGKIFWLQNGYIFLREVHLIKIIGENIQERNVSFICLKISDIENIIMMEEPDLPEMNEPVEEVKPTSSNQPKTRITWEDTGSEKREVTLLYVISGISWKSEYFLDTYTPFEDGSEEESRLEHWASIKSNLNIDLEDVNVRLVAGDIQLQSSGMHWGNDGIYAMSTAQLAINSYAGRSNTSPGNSEPSSFTMQEFEVYTIPYKITLKKGETKKLQIQNCDVEITEEFVYDATHLRPSRNRYSTWNGEQKGKVEKILKIKNNGKTWPEGMVSVYQDYMLIGQDGIEWTPKGREAKVTIGTASDIVVKKKATVKETSPDDRHHDDYEYKITLLLTNYKDKQVTVKVFDTFVSDALNLKSNPDFEEKPGNKMTWEITIDAGEEKEVVYTYETKD